MTTLKRKGESRARLCAPKKKTLLSQKGCKKERNTSLKGSFLIQRRKHTTNTLTSQISSVTIATRRSIM